jgi:hypothetical protein
VYEGAITANAPGRVNLHPVTYPLGELVFQRRPNALNARLLTTTALGAGATADAVRPAAPPASPTTQKVSSLDNDHV